MKKVLLFAVASAVLIGTLSGLAIAQGQGTYSCPRYSSIINQFGSCRFDFSSSSLPLPDPPVGLVCCNPFGVPGSEGCVVPKWPCATTQNTDACMSCNSGKTAQGSSPIDFATGNTYIVESDVSVPGLGGGLQLVRIWNSLLPAAQQSSPFMFGAAWRSTYEERLIFNSSDSFLKYTRSDGSVWTFAVAILGTQNTYNSVAPATDTSTVVDGALSWTLTSKTGEKRTFDANSGALTAIIDRNGNTTQLSYDTSGRLTTVTDPAARHLYFNYSGSSTLVSTVTSDIGITLSYAYDGQGRLTQVTKPDNTTVSFAYDTGSHIITVTDSNGKILESHTYDVVGRGLTGSRANGVGAVTITYPQ